MSKENIEILMIKFKQDKAKIALNMAQRFVNGNSIECTGIARELLTIDDLLIMAYFMHYIGLTNHALFLRLLEGEIK